jgi:hypothetical protein
MFDDEDFIATYNPDEKGINIRYYPICGILFIVI